MIGIEVFYYNSGEDKVCKGVAYDPSILADGYMSYMVKGEEIKQIREAYIFKTEEEAKAFRAKAKPILDEVNKKTAELQEQAKEIVKQSKIDIMGEPKYLDIANKIFEE